ncbi:MAG: hypothetical protein IJH50_01170 [Kiritimatiellae bacterium]|nr:hypothetical protein [Kiritimatiellia bacterium]
MRHYRNSTFFILHSAFLLAALAVRAGHVSETLTLTNGWNAVYLESTPDTPDPAEFFADLPQVERVGCYESSVYGATEQIASDGSTIAQKPVSFYVWVRGDESLSTLQRIMGGRCYFIYSTAPATKTFYGVPACPRVSWQVAEDGFATIVGVSIPAGETISSGVYFREGPLTPDAVKAPYEAGGQNAAAPEFAKLMAFRGMPTLQGGHAYAFEGNAISDWPGVIKVSTTTLSGAIAFGSGTSYQSFSVSNAGTTNRTIRVGYGPSELSSEEKPPLNVYIPRVGTNAYGWTAFETHDFNLAPGESRTLALAIDKSGFTADQTFAGLVTVSDLSGTKMRVRVPVTAALDADSPYSAAYPKGLWYGNIELSQVDRNSDGAPVSSGGNMKMNAIVLVDGTGAARLMQRVAVGTAKEPDEDGSHAVRLWPETTDVPAEYSSRRISTLFPDVAHRALDATSGTFGNLLQFDWTVAADARDNPFRHAWHPDHGT